MTKWCKDPGGGWGDRVHWLGRIVGGVSFCFKLTWHLATGLGGRSIGDTAPHWSQAPGASKAPLAHTDHRSERPTLRCPCQPEYRCSYAATRAMQTGWAPTPWSSALTRLAAELTGRFRRFLCRPLQPGHGARPGRSLARSWPRLRRSDTLIQSRWPSWPRGRLPAQHPAWRAGTRGVRICARPDAL